MGGELRADKSDLKKNYSTAFSLGYRLVVRSTNSCTSNAIEKIGR